MTIQEPKAAFPSDLIRQRLIGAGYDCTQNGPGQPSSSEVAVAIDLSVRPTV